ncbi:MAG: prepilin-type N-terminal cleavage/methylation domain-containing protein [Candidatus Omnitrophota bacterium]
MLKRKGFTAIEILVVLVIIGTLAALAWPNYMAIKEKSLNREAQASLALIRAAEKIYRMEGGFYYPYGVITNNVGLINTNLRLSLTESASASWTISLDGRSTGSAQALRQGGGGADGRVWSIDFPGGVDPTCSGGTYCPSP